MSFKLKDFVMLLYINAPVLLTSIISASPARFVVYEASTKPPVERQVQGGRGCRGIMSRLQSAPVWVHLLLHRPSFVEQFMPELVLKYSSGRQFSAVVTL